VYERLEGFEDAELELFVGCSKSRYSTLKNSTRMIH